MIPIVVVSKGDERRWHTLTMLSEAGIPATVVVHKKATARMISAAFPNAELDAIFSGTETLVEKRNWILKKLIPKDKWFIGMDDNIQYFTAVRKPFRSRDRNDTTSKLIHDKYSSWREIYNAKISTERWLKLMAQNVRLAESENTPLIGVATMENPYFRVRRYSNYRFVKTKVFAMKNTRKLYFKHELCHDSYLSAACVAEYGKVLVDSFLHYKSKMYEVGGLGNREERETRGLIEQMDKVVKEFDGLVVRASGKNSALRFRLTNFNSVSKWIARNV